MMDGDPLPINQYLLFHSPKVATWLEDNGHRLRRRDVNAVRTDEEGGGLAVDPRPTSLPIVRIYDDDSKRLLWEGLPATEAEFLETLARYSPRRQPGTDTGRRNGSTRSAVGGEPVDCPDGTCPPKKPTQSQPRRRGLLRWR
jgi:hypothetical protein